MQAFVLLLLIFRPPNSGTCEAVTSWAVHFLLCPGCAPRSLQPPPNIYATSTYIRFLNVLLKRCLCCARRRLAHVTVDSRLRSGRCQRARSFTTVFATHFQHKCITAVTVRRAPLPALKILKCAAQYVFQYVCNKTGHVISIF